MMGTLNDDKRNGVIFLRQPVCLQFDRVLSQTPHSTADTFLEHLFELFTSSLKAAGQLRVRDDVAQKFLALQCHTGQFTTSDDFMKHLLELHIEHSKTETCAKVVPEKTTGRKSRKSQPKRNIKHSLMVGDHEPSDDMAPLYHREGEAQAADIKKSPVLDMRTQEGQGQTGVNGTDGINTAPLCLTLQKPKIEPGTQPLTSACPPKLHQFGRYVYESERDSVQDMALGSSTQPMSLPHTPEKGRGEMDGDRNGYTYVLNSLDSPIQEKYQKSIIYTMSSDEDEPKDLSVSNSLDNIQPQNLTVAKTKGTSQVAVKVEDVIKYDRNANHVAVSGKATQAANSPYLLQHKAFSPPANLVFTDQQVSRNGMIGQPQLLGIPQSINNSPQDLNQSAVAATGHQQGIFINTGAGQVQLIAVRPNGQTQALPTILPHSFQTASPPRKAALTPTSAPTDAGLNSSQELSSGNMSDSDRIPGEPRKKRKRMEDTTSFRDPPEQSLPFNGPNKYRFYCDVCDTGFTRRYTFNRHKCKGRVEKHYCQLCDKAYLSKYKLKDHILVKHEGQTVNCPDCGKRFSSRSSMEMHKKQQHEGQFSIWCKICGKGFNHTGHYYGHMNKHTNTKPFWCQQCGKRFYGSSYLHNHKQVCRGNNDLNFACTLCDRKFKCELYLKKHMKVHENVPITGDPTIAKVTDEELEHSNFIDPANEDGIEMNGDDDGVSKAVFPGQPDSDSNSNSGLLIIDEKESSSSGEPVNRQAVTV